jgi:hypothetical protein
MRPRAAILAILGACLVIAPAADAYSGQITRAWTNANWTRGNIAGSVTWTDCTDPCSWIPYATVQPSLPDYRCLGDELLDNDPNTSQIWSGGGHTTNGTASFDLPNTPILTGVYGQRVCLMAIETLHIRDPVCVAQAPILGLDPNDCPFIDRYVGRVIATALLTQAPVLVLDPPAPPQPPKKPSTEIKPDPVSVLTKTEARNGTTKALSRKFGKRWKRGRSKHLKCARRSETKLSCAVSWRFGDFRYKGRVTVSESHAGVKARIVDVWRTKLH